MLEWIYGQIVGFLGNFFAQMGAMGTELFDMAWVQSIVLFFSYLGWSLYGTGLVVSAFECGIGYQTGRGANIANRVLAAIKGFLAVNLFTKAPIELFKLSVDLQASLTSGITGYGSGIDTVAGNIIERFQESGSLADIASANLFGGLGTITSPFLVLFIIIMMGYAVIKVFFSNLKRGGILLIQICVGSLHMFSIVRGYTDGFVQWMKQVIGLCLTTFLQATILIAGLMVLQDHCLLGLGLMLSAGEVPRIAGLFGLDTTTHANLMSAVYTVQNAVNVTRTVVQAAAK